MAVNERHIMPAVHVMAGDHQMTEVADLFVKGD